MKKCIFLLAIAFAQININAVRPQTRQHAFKKPQGQGYTHPKIQRCAKQKSIFKKKRKRPLVAAKRPPIVVAPPSCSLTSSDIGGINTSLKEALVQHEEHCAALKEKQRLYEQEHERRSWLWSVQEGPAKEKPEDLKFSFDIVKEREWLEQHSKKIEDIMAQVTTHRRS